MDLDCVVGDAWEVLADIRGNRGYPGSCALKALPNVQEEHVRTGGARCYRNNFCLVRDVHCCVRERTADVLMTGLYLCSRVADATPVLQRLVIAVVLPAGRRGHADRELVA
jgi:hypothetical protein